MNGTKKENFNPKNLVLYTRQKLWRGYKRPLKFKKRPSVLVPVFPGTNCETDTIYQFTNIGAECKELVFKNKTSDDIKKSVKLLSQAIKKTDILVLAGGFSAGDEPDGAAKFIANVLEEKSVKQEVRALLKRNGLILGICNGFQALMRAGYFGVKQNENKNESPMGLVPNANFSHVARYVSVKARTLFSPWLKGSLLSDIIQVPVSHKEGRFYASEQTVKHLLENDQIAFQYVGEDGKPTMQSPFNPNGSTYAVEGLLSPCGLVLGKMSHPERTGAHLAKNIPGDKSSATNIFQNAVEFFQGKQKTEKVLRAGKTKKILQGDSKHEHTMVFTNCITANNGRKKSCLPEKGELCNMISAFVFYHLNDNKIPTHFIRIKDKVSQLVKATRVLPLEFIVRNFAAGSFAKKFGFPYGKKLPNPTFEICYKSDALDDPLMAPDHAFAMELITLSEYEEIKAISLKINKLLTKLFADAKILLVDFKLEFGWSQEAKKLLVIDEFSPDNARLWEANTNKVLDKDNYRNDKKEVIKKYKTVWKLLCETN